MSPHSELVQNIRSRFVSLTRGRIYHILTYGGVAKVKMDENADSKTFMYRWYNPGKANFMMHYPSKAPLT